MYRRSKHPGRSSQYLLERNNEHQVPHDRVLPMDFRKPFHHQRHTCHSHRSAKHQRDASFDQSRFATAASRSRTNSDAFLSQDYTPRTSSCRGGCSTSVTTTTSKTSGPLSVHPRVKDLQPTQISVNVRLSKSRKTLLPEDVFIPIKGLETLADIYQTALRRHSDQVDRYIPRHERRVRVICHDERKNTYAKTTALFFTIARLRPMRLIYCVYPNAERIRELELRKKVVLDLNARYDTSREKLLDRDVRVEMRGHATMLQLWNGFVSKAPTFKNLTAVAVSTKRPEDKVTIRFGMQDRVSDLVQSSGYRFYFLIEDPNVHSATHSGDQNDGIKRSKSWWDKLSNFLRGNPMGAQRMQNRNNQIAACPHSA